MDGLQVVKRVQEEFAKAVREYDDDTAYGNAEVTQKWHWASLTGQGFKFRGGAPSDEEIPHGLKFLNDIEMDVYQMPAGDPAQLQSSLEKLACTFPNLNGKGDTYKPVASLVDEFAVLASGWSPQERHQDLFLRSSWLSMQVYSSPEGSLYLSFGEGRVMAYFIRVFEPSDFGDDDVSW